MNITTLMTLSTAHLYTIRALLLMYEQYCAYSGHDFMGAGEAAMSELSKYTDLGFDGTGALPHENGICKKLYDIVNAIEDEIDHRSQGGEDDE